MVKGKQVYPSNRVTGQQKQRVTEGEVITLQCIIREELFQNVILVQTYKMREASQQRN